MPEFKPGDIVMLKSGGPEMTIGSVKTDNSCNCCYFDYNSNDGHWTLTRITLSADLLKLSSA